jgi:hypothetical protein
MPRTTKKKLKKNVKKSKPAKKPAKKPIKKASKKLTKKKLPIKSKKSNSNSLLKKLGLKDSYRMGFVGASDEIIDSFKIPKKVIVSKKLTGAFDYIHIYSKDSVKLMTEFRDARAYLKMNGMIWVSWPKLTSGVKSDLNENIVREIGLNFGLVDVKVVSLDDTWSALKFVYRLTDRT